MGKIDRLEGREEEKRAALVARWEAGCDSLHLVSGHLRTAQALVQCRKEEALERREIQKDHVVDLFDVYQCGQASRLVADEKERWRHLMQSHVAVAYTIVEARLFSYSDELVAELWNEEEIARTELRDFCQSSAIDATHRHERRLVEEAVAAGSEPIVEEESACWSGIVQSHEEVFPQLVEVHHDRMRKAMEAMENGERLNIQRAYDEAILDEVGRCLYLALFEARGNTLMSGETTAMVQAWQDGITTAVLVEESRNREDIERHEVEAYLSISQNFANQRRRLRISSAAGCIQRCSRSIAQRKSLSDRVFEILWRRRTVACITTQRYLRALESRLLSTSKRQHAASELLHRVQNGFVCRLATNRDWKHRLQSANRRLQSAGRGFLCREELSEAYDAFLAARRQRKALEVDAAQQIQWCGRHYLAKKEAWRRAQVVAIERHRCDMVVRMQSTMRYRFAHSAVADRSKARFLERVVKIQSVGRANRSRSGTASLRYVVRMQAFFRAKLTAVVVFLNERNVPARRIQRAARMMLANRHIALRRAAHKQFIQERLRHNAAIRLQRMARDWLCRNAARLAKFAAWRTRLGVVERLVEDYVEDWQKLCRGYLHSRRLVGGLYRKKVAAVTVLQQYTRRRVSSLDRLQKEEQTLQLLRSQLEVNLARYIRYMSEESIQRGLQTFSDTQRTQKRQKLHRQIVLIQSFCRAFLQSSVVSTRFVVRHSSAVRIQSQWRGHEGRRLAVAVKRRRAEEAEIRRIHGMASRLQRWWTVIRRYRRFSAAVIQSAFLHRRKKLATLQEQLSAVRQLHLLRRKALIRQHTVAWKEVAAEEAQNRQLLKEAAPIPAERLVPLQLPETFRTKWESSRNAIEAKAVKAYREIIAARRDEKRGAELATIVGHVQRTSAMYVRNEHVLRHRIISAERHHLRALRLWFAEGVDHIYSDMRKMDVEAVESQMRLVLETEYEGAVELLIDHAEQLTLLLDDVESETGGSFAGSARSSDDGGASVQSAASAAEYSVAAASQVMMVIDRQVPARVVRHLRAFANVPTRGRPTIAREELLHILSPPDVDATESVAAESIATTDVPSLDPSPTARSVRIASSTVIHQASDFRVEIGGDSVVYVVLTNAAPASAIGDDIVPTLKTLLSGREVVSGFAFPQGSSFSTGALLTLLEFAKQQSYPLSRLDLRLNTKIDDIAALHLARLIQESATIKEVVLSGTNVSLRKRQLIRHLLLEKDRQRSETLQRRASSLRGKLSKVLSERKSSTVEPAADEVPLPERQYRGRPLLFPRRPRPIVNGMSW